MLWLRELAPFLTNGMSVRGDDAGVQHIITTVEAVFRIFRSGSRNEDG